LELKQKSNRELFALYEGELAFRHHSAKGLEEAKRVLLLYLLLLMYDCVKQAGA
jgi:hypothetical protein